jgi:hypothetical protein
MPPSTHTYPQLPAWLLLSIMGLACSNPGDPAGPGGAAGSNGNDPPPAASCDFGDDPDKCSGRSDLACAPAVIFGADACTTDTQCSDDELCLVDQDTGEAACSEVVGECAPRCGGDFDCEDGQACDPESGECTSSAVSGKRFGEACDPQADECAGVCIEFADGTAECEEACRVGAPSGCGQEEIAGSSVACAYFAYDLSDLDVEQGSGDTGICAKLCDCDDDCPDSQMCLAISSGDYAGVCTGGLSAEQGTTCEP